MSSNFVVDFELLLVYFLTNSMFQVKITAIKSTSIPNRSYNFIIILNRIFVYLSANSIYVLFVSPFQIFELCLIHRQNSATLALTFLLFVFTRVLPFLSSFVCLFCFTLQRAVERFQSTIMEIIF